MKKFVLTIFVLTLLIALSGSLFAQKTIVPVVSDYTNSTEGNLNNAVTQVVGNGGDLSNYEFQLEPNGEYILTAAISVPKGQTLTITAPDPGTTQETAPPQIVWTISAGANTQYNFDVWGNISLKNIWVMYAGTDGKQIGTTLCMEEDTDAVAQYGTFEGCIFDYDPCPANVSSGAVTVANDHFVGSFKNCYFKNCVDSHFRYYGRALSFPYNTTGRHTDSVSFENTTFANLGYVFMQEGGEHSDYVKFNHCTFLNIVMFALESGWWKDLTITNSIFVNTFMFGDILAQREITDTVTNTITGFGDPNGGVFRVDSISTFGFTPSWSEQDRHILLANSNYYVEQWLRNWMGIIDPNTSKINADANPYSQRMYKQRQNDQIPAPQPMLSPNTIKFLDSLNTTGNKLFPYMNAANLDSTSNPSFNVPTTDTAMIKIYLNKKWDDNTDTTWAWRYENDWNQLWPLAENLSYTNTTLQTAGFANFPLGDLYHWWNPAFKTGATDYYTSWKAQVATEDARIATWLSTGKDPNGPSSVKGQIGTPGKFELGQNYPNPFNPTTNIDYTVPAQSNVSLKVYNILGKEVATLYSGMRQAGTYHAEFNAAKFASGVYFYRLQAGNVSITKKLVLMK